MTVLMAPSIAKRSSPSSAPGCSHRRFIPCAATAVVLILLPEVSAWSSNNNIHCKRYVSISSSRPISIHSLSSTKLDNAFTDVAPEPEPDRSTINRRDGLKQMLSATLATTTFTQTQLPQPASAYTPDPDPLRESLYLMSRVQEATVQQERFVNRATQQETLKSKMKLTLRLVEKNYRLLDQITFASEYVTPASAVVEATTAGYEAAEALQNAIDYVNSDLRAGAFEKGQKEYLTSNLGECRERMFDFLSYMPKDKLEGARKRVEEENVANRDEFDGESDAGVYNPVVLPWKDR